MGLVDILIFDSSQLAGSYSPFCRLMPFAFQVSIRLLGLKKNVLCMTGICRASETIFSLEK